jgi:hypothetical protein
MKLTDLVEYLILLWLAACPCDSSYVDNAEKARSTTGRRALALARWTTVAVKPDCLNFVSHQQQKTLAQVPNQREYEN